MGGIGRFAFLFALAFGCLPTVALAQRISFTGEGDQAFRLVRVRRGMDLRTLVRMANEFDTRPGVTITEDDVVAANPGKINYACYYGRGNHTGRRDPSYWDTCPDAQHLRWVVTPERGRPGLWYRLPLQPMNTNDSEASASESVSTGITPSTSSSSSASSPSATTSATTPSPELARLAAGLEQNQRQLDRVNGRISGLSAYQAELSDYQARSHREQKTLWGAFIVVCLLLCYMLYRAFRGVGEQNFTHPNQALGQLTPAYAGAASLERQPAASGVRDQRLLEDAVQRAVLPVTAARDAANARVSNLESERNALQARLDAAEARANDLQKRLDAQHSPPPSPVQVRPRDDWRNPDDFMPVAPFTAGKDRLVSLYRESRNVWHDLNRTRLHLRILKEWPEEARKRPDPQRFAERQEMLTQREATLVARLAGLRMGFESLLLAHTGLALPELWEPSDVPPDLQEHEVKLAKLEEELGQVRDAAAVAEQDYERKLTLAREEADSQRRLRTEDVAGMQARIDLVRDGYINEINTLLTEYEALLTKNGESSSIITRLEERLRRASAESEVRDRESAAQVDTIRRQEAQIAELSQAVLARDAKIAMFTAELKQRGAEVENLRAMMNGLVDESSVPPPLPPEPTNPRAYNMSEDPPTGVVHPGRMAFLSLEEAATRLLDTFPHFETAPEAGKAFQLQMGEVGLIDLMHLTNASAVCPVPGCGKRLRIRDLVRHSERVHGMLPARRRTKTMRPQSPLPAEEPSRSGGRLVIPAPPPTGVPAKRVGSRASKLPPKKDG